jgi:hypothetical protein
MDSMEYYFQWQLSQYSDSLDAGPYVVCFIAEARDYPGHQISRGAHLVSCSVDVVGSFPAVEAADL